MDDNEQLEQQPADTETVEVHEATVDDLDAALKSAQDAERNSDEVVTEQSAEPQLEQQTPAEQQPAPPAGAQPSTPRVYSEDEVRGLHAETERLRQEGSQKELFIQRRNTEVGQLRGQLANARQQLLNERAQREQGLEDRYQENPRQAHQDADRIKEIDQTIEQIDIREETAVRIAESQTFFLRHVDPNVATLDAIADVLRADGIPEQHINSFKSNPFNFTTPEALVQMGKRVMDRAQFTQADGDRRLLAKYAKSLEQRIQQLQGKPNQVMQQVQRHLNQAPSLNGNVPAASSRQVPDVDVTRMSTDQLDQVLRQSGGVN